MGVWVLWELLEVLGTVLDGFGGFVDFANKLAERVTHPRIYSFLFVSMPIWYMYVYM